MNLAFCLLFAYIKSSFLPHHVSFLHIINIKFFLCRAGYLPQNIPLEIIRYLSEEKDFLPWHATSRALYPLDKLLDRMEKYNVFNVKRYIFFFLLFRR